MKLSFILCIYLGNAHLREGKKCIFPVTTQETTQAIRLRFSVCFMFQLMQNLYVQALEKKKFHEDTKKHLRADIVTFVSKEIKT